MTIIFAYARVSTAERTGGQFSEIEQAGYRIDEDFRFMDVGVRWFRACCG